MIFFGRVFTALSFCFLIVSCAQEKLEDRNEDFMKKYGAQVGVINKERAPPAGMPDPTKQVTNSSAPSMEQIAAETANDYYPYVDIANLGDKVPQIHLPNAEFYGQEKGKNPSNTPPADMFEITYNTKLSPPFRRRGAEFDVIKIPPYDVYGVKTAMSEKTYLLPGGQDMQQAVDLIEVQKTSQDDEIGAILVAEKKQIIRKRKMVKMLGEDYSSRDLAEIDAKKPAKKSPQKEKIVQSAPAANGGISDFFGKAFNKN